MQFYFCAYAIGSCMHDMFFFIDMEESRCLMKVVRGSRGLGKGVESSDNHIKYEK